MKYLFDKEWFLKRQKVLLFLCNSFLLKYWFRYLLRIHKDLSFKENISCISPNSYEVYLGIFLIEGKLRHKYRGDFRTHTKFSKRIKYAFYPIWWLAHQWDMIIANPLCPALNLGFDTLAVFAGAGDGQVQHGEVGNWDVTHDAATGTSANPTATGSSAVMSQQISAGVSYRIRRAFFPFDTSALGAGATVSAVTMSIYVTNAADVDNDGDDWINVVQTTQDSTSTLITADYNQCGAVNNPTEGATRIDIGDITAGQYIDWTLNATGRGWITIDGISKLGMREGHDALDNPVVVTGETGLNIRFSEYSGTDSDPKLVITYSIPSGPADLKSVNGVATADVKSINGVATVDVKSVNGIT